MLGLARSLILLASFIYSPHLGASDYANALDKAKTAALIQTGIQGQISALGAKCEEFVKTSSMSYEASIGAYAYRAYRTKTLIIPMSRDYTMTVSTSMLGLTLRF